MDRRSLNPWEALVIVVLIALVGWTVAWAYARGHTILLPIVVLVAVYWLIKKILFGPGSYILVALAC